MSISNIYSLRNKVALVTGATGHLGKSMAEGLAMAGATVYVNGRTKNTVIKLTEYLNSKGYCAYPAIFDITDYKSSFSNHMHFVLNDFVKQYHIINSAV